jgi:hypothetical protein
VYWVATTVAILTFANNRKLFPSLRMWLSVVAASASTGSGSRERATLAQKTCERGSSDANLPNGGGESDVGSTEDSR